MPYAGQNLAADGIPRRNWTTLTNRTDPSEHPHARVAEPANSEKHVGSKIVRVHIWGPTPSWFHRRP